MCLKLPLAVLAMGQLVQLMHTKLLAAAMEQLLLILHSLRILWRFRPPRHHHAAASSLLSLLADTDFHTDIKWAMNATSADGECEFEIDGDYDDDLPPALPPATTKKGIGGGCSPRKNPL